MAVAEMIERFTVSRDDAIHESFPDLALAANGDLVVTYQESECHGGGPVSTIVVRWSADEGQTWSDRIVIAETARERDGWLNCSRITRLHDGTLLLVVDCIPQNAPSGAHRWWGDNRAVTWLFRSADHGRSWSGPEVTRVRGGIVPSITQLADGTLLIGITSFEEDNDWRQYQVLFRSEDLGRTWSGPLLVARHDARQPNEGDFVELPTGEIVCYMRDDEAGVQNGLKAISRDGGRTWGDLYGSGPWLYMGRPSVGLLSTGEVFLTTRVGAPQAGHCFGAYLEPPGAALRPTPLTDPPAPQAHWAILDDDDNPEVPDWGYSGWVELPDRSVYAVQYITTAAAPPHKPFLRGYLIPRAAIDGFTRPEPQ
ncbi:MAG: exo-alpha-sialidase [Armatimonadetes bacterium]|nr:exo-alpha-sialidase [Armatimonadota bacterium]